MNIAFTMAPGRGDTDLLLCRLTQSLQDRGVRTCGTVQINTERADADRCDMDVKVLPDGPVLRISQSLGPGSRGCRLDASALETAVGLVARRLAGGADCLIVNKFGKHEAAGRGFRFAIADALSRDIPVLVGLNRLNTGAFLEFTAGAAVELAPCEADVRAWLHQVRAPGTRAA